MDGWMNGWGDEDRQDKKIDHSGHLTFSAFIPYHIPIQFWKYQSKIYYTYFLWMGQ